MSFPLRVYTEDEVKRARELVANGYRHRIRISGSEAFQRNADRALELTRIAGYFDFLTTYIREIVEIDGLTQLRNADAAIWANKYALNNPVDAASMFVQKANQMKEYLELKHYYSGEAEKRSVKKRIEFLTVLRDKTQDRLVIEECERLLDLWRDGALVY